MQADGCTLREHLEAAQKITKKTPEQLIGPELPPEAAHWWQWWHELAGGRQSGMSANPISWPDMAAWLRLTGRSLDAWDVQAIRSIDAAFMDMAKQGEKKANKGR